jgi:hypothetical protein
MPIPYAKLVETERSPLLCFLHENAGWGFSADELLAEGFRDFSDLPEVGVLNGITYYGVERVGVGGPLPPVRPRSR